jgi:hypothetical protein
MNRFAEAMWMALLQEELEVDRPIEAVFSFVADFAHTKDWDPGVADARKVTDGPVGVGTRYAVDPPARGSATRRTST